MNELDNRRLLSEIEDTKINLKQKLEFLKTSMWPRVTKAEIHRLEFKLRELMDKV